MANGFSRQGGSLSSAAVPNRQPVEVFFDDASRTRQEFADECDINILMKRFEATGVVSHVNQREPMYMDLDEVPDLREALDIVREANEAFMTLPAQARASFDNDPVKFVEFAADPANVDQMRSWGLAKPAPVEAPPQKVEVINPPPSPPKP